MNELIFKSLSRQHELEHEAGDEWNCFVDRYGVNFQYEKKSHRKLIFLSSAASILLLVTLYILIPSAPVENDLFAFVMEQEDLLTNTTITTTRGDTMETTVSHASIELIHNGQQLSVEDKVVDEVPNGNSVFINTLKVPYGKTAKILLADGTQVWLNAGSQLIFPNHFRNSDKREVMLVGEGYFEVAHNPSKAFRVLTNDMTYTVLGTAFNINAYDGEQNGEAVLVNGSLQIEHNNSAQKVVLEPGQKASLNKGLNRMSTFSVDPALYTSWKDGYLTLNHATFSQLIRQVECYYNYQIVFDKQLLSESDILSGKLLLEEEPENVINALCDLVGVECKINGSRIELYRPE
ncbi:MULTISPECIES: FecR family protein [unclassified Carboxylicivirga]|uniref:FecR family protein n=1 Tax=Carboxylicivirga TaxID=1628153 RepID=UPI003D34049A